MKLMKNREKSFKIFKPIKKNINGDIIITYEETGEFLGSMQPVTERQVNEEYGITLNNSYNVYSKSLINALDRLFLDGVYYEVKLIKKWDSYFIYSVTEVLDE